LDTLIIENNLFVHKMYNVAYSHMPLLMWAQKRYASEWYWWHQHRSFLTYQTDSVTTDPVLQHFPVSPIYYKQGGPSCQLFIMLIFFRVNTPLNIYNTVYAT